MDAIKDFLNLILSPEGLRQIIQWGGYPGLAIIVFAETGLLVGFFLPGDSLLVTAGLLAGMPNPPLNIIWLNVILIPMAIIGDAVGYAIGRRTGDALLKRPDGKLFKRKHVEKAQTFYAKHGGKAIVMARFVPIVRTFVPTLAGVAKMPYSEFVRYNVFGGALWVLTSTLLGYFLGKSIKNIERYIYLVIGIIIVVSFIPPIIEYIRARNKAKAQSSDLS